MRLRAYSFDRYKTKRKDDEQTPAAGEGRRSPWPSVAAVQKAFASRDAIANGVMLARDLVNEPPNVLYPGRIRPPHQRAQEARRRR